MTDRRVLAAYIGLGVLLAPLPLLNVLQAESTAVVALVAFFVAGWSAVDAFGEEQPFSSVLLRQELALLVPLSVLTLTQLWAPNCTYLEGLLFFGLFPVVTVVFAVSLAYALTGMELSAPAGWLVGIGALVVVAGPVYDLGFHPQFYTYNHVFGGVLGPIYDEQLALRPGLFAFRGLTLLWSFAAVLLGRRLRGYGPRWLLPLCAVAIGGVYLFSAPLGLNTPAWYLQEQLGGHTQTAHFDLYYESSALDSAEVSRLATVHEARYIWVRDQVGVSPSAQQERVQSYIYATPDQKGRLTGARQTSVSPVWLADPQVHVLRARVSESLGHELAHVVSRPYGLPLFNASWAPGLIEGWAVALEPPSAGPSPDDLVRTALATDTTTQALDRAAEAIASRLSPWGFWTGRGAVSYATMGSFVRYLLDRYGAEPLKRVYARANFEVVYGRSLPALTAEWSDHLKRLPVQDRESYSAVRRRFTRPSLFETECPHYVPPARQSLHAADEALRNRDTTAAVAHLQESLRQAPTFAAAHARLARIRLARGQLADAHRQLDTLATDVLGHGLRVALADAKVLQGAEGPGRALYRDALSQMPLYASGSRARILLRDAVAERPAVVRILVSADSAATQARRLAGVVPQSGAVRAWRALRWMDANRFGPAVPLWRTVESTLPASRPPARRREWRLQYYQWGATAAVLTGSTGVGVRWARRGGRMARDYGAQGRARVFDWWAARGAASGAITASLDRRLSAKSNCPPLRSF